MASLCFINVTNLIVIIFLVLTLFLGIYSGRNIKDFKDYVLGRRRFSTFTLTLTFLATEIGGGSIIGAPGEIYKYGIILTVGCLGLSIQYLILSFLTPRILKFKNCITIGDIMGEIYGVKIKFITGIVTFFGSLFIISLQLMMLGLIFENLFNINPEYGIIISGILLAIYSAIGGIKSVTYTDVLQFLVLIIAFPILATLSVKKVGGYKNLFLKIPIEKFYIIDNPKFYYWLSYFLLLSVFLEVLIGPAYIQRILMAKNSIQLKNKFRSVACIDPIFRILIMIIGLSAIVLCPNIDPKLTIFYIIKNAVQNNILKGFIISGLFAVVMSSVDSRLHSSGVVFINDIIKPCKNKINQLLYTRIATIITGLICIVIAVKFTDSIYFRHLSFLKIAISSPVILCPLVAGILGVKSTERIFYLSAIVGVLSLFFASKYLTHNFKPLIVPIGIFFNALTFIFLNMLENRGFFIINRDYDKKRPQKIVKPSLNSFKKFLKIILPTPHKIFEFSRKSVITCGSANVLFGIITCINFVIPYFIWDYDNKNIFNMITNLRFFGAILGGLLIVKSEWKESLKTYFPLFWHFSLLYCLPFISTFMFLVTKGSLLWFVSIGISIFFLIMLTETTIFAILQPIGMFLAIIFYKYKIGTIDFSNFFVDLNYELVYQIIFSSTVSLLFSHRKKIFNSIRSHQGTNLGLAMCHELRNTGLYIYPSAQINNMYLKKYVNKMTKIDKKDVYCLEKSDFESVNNQSQEIERLGKQMKKIVRTFEKLLMEYNNSLNDPQNFSMKYLINLTISQFNFKKGQKEKLYVDLKNDFIVKVPKQIFIFILDNIIRNAYVHSNPKTINIFLRENELHVRDDGKGINENEMSQIFKMYFTTGNASSSGIGLAFAKQIIDGFGGEIWVDSETVKKSYTEFTIKFPKIFENFSQEELTKNIKDQVKQEVVQSLKSNNFDEKMIKKILDEK